MKKIEYKKVIDNQQAVRVELDKYGATLLTTMNGYQWSGCSIKSVEMAEVVIEVLQEFIKDQKENPPSLD